MEQNIQQPATARPTSAIRQSTDTTAEVISEQGYSIYSLKNDAVSLSVVPDLGAKLISLKDLRTGREWMWHPDGGLKLFTNHSHDDFSKSPLAGLDECLPTIAPCVWRGRQLPDHGELWSMPWEVDEKAWAQCQLRTHIRLRLSPFEFTRTVELRRNVVHLNYELKNLSHSEEHYLWAMHPLLRIESGDRVELPESVSNSMNQKNWHEPLFFAAPDNGSLKTFARPIREGRAAVKDSTGRNRLEFIWDAAENNTLGLWLTRGGWHGHHHFAVEPANAADDSLATAVARGEGGHVPGLGTITWSVQMRVGI